MNGSILTLSFLETLSFVSAHLTDLTSKTSLTPKFIVNEDDESSI